MQISSTVDAGVRKVRSLEDILEEADEITIVCHNNPDPDCLASALALGRIAAAAGIDERRILYSGMISHQQNRAFVNLLDIDLEPFEPAKIRHRPHGSLLAFVDHATPGENNEVPPTTPIDIVIDHHPADGTIEARFVDHRETVGATATILTEYLQRFEIDLDPALATGLLFAIHRETLGFLRGVTRAEFVAAGFLSDFADFGLLRALSTPSVSGATIDAISEAIDNRTVSGSTLISNVGRTNERDALPQAADYLATLEGVETAIVFGIVGDHIQLCGRSMDSRVHVGKVLKSAFGDIGSAGGHREMGGGEIPLGIFADTATDDPRFVSIVEQIVADRLATGLHLHGDTRGRDSRGADE